MSNLEWHSCPVLSLALLELTEDSASQGQSDTCPSLSPASPGCLLVSGGTDGGLALWHLQQHGLAACPGQAAGQVEAQRVLCLPGLHQSGVNAASIAIMPHAEGKPIQVCHQDKLEHSSGCSRVTTLMDMQVPMQVLQCVCI